MSLGDARCTRFVPLSLLRRILHILARGVDPNGFDTTTTSLFLFDQCDPDGHVRCGPSHIIQKLVRTCKTGHTCTCNQDVHRAWVRRIRWHTMGSPLTRRSCGWLWVVVGGVNESPGWVMGRCPKFKNGTASYQPCTAPADGDPRETSGETLERHPEKHPHLSNPSIFHCGYTPSKLMAVCALLCFWLDSSVYCFPYTLHY